MTTLLNALLGRATRIVVGARETAQGQTVVDIADFLGEYLISTQGKKAMKALEDSNSRIVFAEESGLEKVVVCYLDGTGLHLGEEGPGAWQRCQHVWTEEVRKAATAKVVSVEEAARFIFTTTERKASSDSVRWLIELTFRLKEAEKEVGSCK